MRGQNQRGREVTFKHSLERLELISMDSASVKPESNATVERAHVPATGQATMTVSESFPFLLVIPSMLGRISEPHWSQRTLKQCHGKINFLF